jgi:hypothetical protein
VEKYVKDAKYIQGDCSSTVGIRRRFYFGVICGVKG